MDTYSFADISGSIFNPLAGSFLLTGGNVGIGSISIEPLTDRSKQNIASDGNVLVSYQPGDNAQISIEIQQTSILHKYLQSLHNRIIAAAKVGDMVAFAATTINVRAILEGSQHICNGVTFLKSPPKVYSAEPQMLTWVLLAAEVINR